jgi:hemerythrin-like domain-containing protein
MHNPIQILLDEHEIISSAEGVIKKLDQYWERSEEGFTEYVSELLQFFRTYSDQYHHYKEEEVLFPLFKDSDEMVVHSMILEFKEHHEMFREHTQAIKAQLEKGQYSETYAILVTYINELLDHIAAENDEFFVITESLLSEAELETMYFKFRDIDVELGEGRKEELSEMLKTINLSIDDADSVNRH